jgi:hypothetical protein
MRTADVLSVFIGDSPCSITWTTTGIGSDNSDPFARHEAPSHRTRCASELSLRRRRLYSTHATKDDYCHVHQVIEPTAQHLARDRRLCWTVACYTE